MPLAHTSRLTHPVRPVRGREERTSASPLRRRARVLIHRGALDRELARGADPERSEDLALRARQLCSPRRRAAIADSLEEAVDLAERPSERLGSAVPLAARDVRAARAALLALARELRAPGEVRVQGIVLAEQLLTDGESPLYFESADADRLWRQARAATAALCHTPR